MNMRMKSGVGIDGGLRTLGMVSLICELDSPVDRALEVGSERRIYKLDSRMDRALEVSIGFEL